MGDINSALVSILEEYLKGSEKQESKKGAVVLIDMGNFNFALEQVKRKQHIKANKKLNFHSLIDFLTHNKDILVKKVYYPLCIDEAKELGQRKFIAYLANNGFEVLAKKPKTIKSDEGCSYQKNNMDVEIAFDISRIVHEESCEEIMLFSGDSDFDYAVQQARLYNIKVTIVSSLNTISRELIDSADKYVMLDHIPLEMFCSNR